MKNLVMCGCHIGGKDVISNLLKNNYTFEYFVCLTPQQAEHHKVSGYFDYRQLAQDYNIPCYIPKTYSLKHEHDVEFFKKHNFDLIIQGGWQRLFPSNILSTLKIGALGLHGSSNYLPKGRGRSPLNWSLIENKDRFLMHLFIITPGVDDGDVIDVLSFDINQFDDIKTLYYKYSIVYRQLLLKNLPNILTGQVTTLPQIGKPSYYEKRSPKDGKLDWEVMDLKVIYNAIRAQTHPYPGAFAEVNGKVMKIWAAHPFDTRINYPNHAYGSIVETLDDYLLIRCLDGLLLVTQYEYIS